MRKETLVVKSNQHVGKKFIRVTEYSKGEELIFVLSEEPSKYFLDVNKNQQYQQALNDIELDLSYDKDPIKDVSIIILDWDSKEGTIFYRDLKKRHSILTFKFSDYERDNE